MRFSLPATALLLGLLLPASAQQDADEKYITIFGIVQQADDLTASGDPRHALASLTEALTQLERFQKMYPDWNPAIVNYRLDDLAKKIGELKTHVAAMSALAPKPKATTPAAPQPSAEEQSLRTQLLAAQADNETLQAKLKEALATQPAAVDAGELTKAQDEIRNLTKENDLLKANAAMPKTDQPDPGKEAALRRQMADTEKKYAQEHARAEDLAVSNAALLRDLKHANTQMAQPTPMAQAAPSVTGTSDATVTALERDALEKKLSEMSTKSESEKISDLRHQLTDERNRAEDLAAENAALKRAGSQHTGMTAQQSSDAVMELERGALENKLKQLSAEVDKTHAGNFEGRIRDLTEQRDELTKQLSDARRKNPNRMQADVAAMNKEVDTLRARVAVAESQAVPYSVEELALLRETPPQPKAATVPSSKRSIHEMPAGTVELVGSAQRHFANHEFDKAEADYKKILEQDPANGLVLANLATIELQEDKLADAEKHITAAVEQKPDDAYNLCTMGYLKFRQEKYDEAFDILSRAAKLDPANPEIQNYLGVTLSHKGMRVQAETALRKAVQLNSLYAPAHNNLSVVYLNQTPSMPLLARWHYQKAIAAGQPRNPDLEKLLAEKGAPYEAP